MRVFVQAVDSGGFSAAAVRLDISTGSISRAIGVLEEHPRTRLLQRTTRRTILTEASEAYLNRCRRIFEQIEEVEAEAAGAKLRRKAVFGYIRSQISANTISSPLSASIITYFPMLGLI
ncbi:LysR family transcriptional regulator [Caballeronia sordidicola]|uniref:LysR family transcriptional regulator n=1 Tax=Caballeronia sordidicola TaxID=196367 RepID=UPI001363EB27|nr:LysR family transcriptional regulator [Caballeronia sordidicola]